MEFKPDFNSAAEQWQRFWDGTNSRPAISAVVPKAGVVPVENPGWFSIMPGKDPGPAIGQLLGWAETHDFLCEAIPFYYLEFAADHFASLLGADLTFRESGQGGWAVPFVDDLDSADIHFDRDGRWWKHTVELAQALRARCDGKLMIASCSLVANVDALAAVYGAEKLLLAMVEEPDAVHRALTQIDQAHGEILDALSELLDYDRFGSINRHGMYCRGRINVTQCDFSCMIGPGMFGEFVVPYLRKELQRLDGGEYHLDGPDAIRHVEALCALDELDLIQWVPGAGEPSTRDWSSLYARIDELGKGQLRHGNSDEAISMWRELRNPKLYVILKAESRAAVEDCVAELEKPRA